MIAQKSPGELDEKVIISSMCHKTEKLTVTGLLASATWPRLL